MVFQLYQVAEPNPHGTLFIESLHPGTTGSKEPTESDAYSGPWSPTGDISFVDGNEVYELSDENESTLKSKKPKMPMHGQGQGASATASKAGCYHPPGFFSTPLDQKASDYSGYTGDYSFPEAIVGESAMDGQGQKASATASKAGCYHPPGFFSTPLDGQGQGASATKGLHGYHHPPGVLSSTPTSQKASGYSDHAMAENISLFELTQIASALGLNIESSTSQQSNHQMELLKKLLALQTSVSDAQGSSSHDASTADSPLTSNCYSKAGYSVVITEGHLCESTDEKGVVVMESGTQFCILIANSNNYGE